MTYQKHNKTVILNIFLSICTVFLMFARACPANATGDKNIVLEMGASRIYTDVLSARSAAVSQCLLAAVEKTAIEMIPFTGLTEKFESISDLISGQRNQFISGYKVLKEVHTEKYYRVLVQVTISTSKLEEALAAAGIVLSPENLPKILFLITEQQADDISPHYWWKKEKSFFQTDAAVDSMKKIFSEKKFSIISDGTLPYGLIKDLDPNDKLTDAQAIEIGKRVQADIIIIGNAIAEEMSNRMGENILTFKATVSARALLTESGEEIARTVHSETNVSRDIAAGSNQSLTDAGFQAGIALTKQILPRWHARMEKTGEITLTVNGTDILPYLVVFRNDLKNIKGINSQQTQEMTPNEAIILVKYDGSSQDLADALLMKSFASFSINIYEASPNSLNIELVEK